MGGLRRAQPSGKRLLTPSHPSNPWRLSALVESRPQILYLAHRVPYPPNRGDRIRSFHQLRFLAQRAHVSLGFLCEEAPPPDTMHVLRSMCRRVAPHRLGRHLRRLRGAWSLATGRTATEGLFGCDGLRRTVSQWAQQTRFDAVFVFCSSMVQYLGAAGLAGVPVVVDLVDVDSQKWLDYGRHSRGPLRWLFQTEAMRLRRLEASLAARAEALVVVSRREAALLQSFCASDRIYAIPNGVDLDHFHPDACDCPGAAETCVFVGALDYRANLEGVTWFCRAIWPGIRQRHPHAVFRLVGRRPGHAARRLARLPGVDLVGEVADVRPYLCEATVVVVPLRIAPGIQNKVLEAMAMGKPIVVTPQAREGVEAAPDVHLCQAETPTEWVQTVARLFTDGELRRRLGCAARQFVEQHFRWNDQLQLLAGLPGMSKCLRPDNAKVMG